MKTPQAPMFVGSVDAALAAYNEVSTRLREAYDELMHEVGRLNEELARKNRELARRERLAALGQLAAGLAHEVRNPLGGIALYASMLEGDVRERPAELGLVRKISHGVRTLDRLVGEILEFAQEDVLERGPGRAGEVLAEALETAAAWTAGRKISLLLSPGAVDVPLYGDVARLRRALVNILINAVQAVGEAGTVWVAARSDEAGACVFEVRDSGPGIPGDVLERVFDPFFTTRASGTGLGLAIVHRIVEAHGGSIRVGNRAEGGAEFTIRIPGCPADGTSVRAVSGAAARGGDSERSPIARRERVSRMAS
ncbi:MAG: ATP-binding protein [Phycisphaerae bacterium]